MSFHYKIFKFSPIKIFIFLSFLFLLFSFTVYLKPLKTIAYQDPSMLERVALGKNVWQKNNCHTCHQLYGLGGYLGPDLTNVVAKSGYSDMYLQTVIRNGMNQMPPFDLTSQEMEDLLEFLKAMNQTGSANPQDYSPKWYGIFTLKK